MTHRIRAIVFTFAASLLSVPLHAQSADILPVEIRRLALAVAVSDREEAITEIADNAVKVRLASDGKRASREFLAFRRADVQMGSSSGASGTTSAASSPLLPAIFGMAFEDGALTRSIAGSTITINASPAGLICANGPAGAAVAARDPETCRTVWKRFAASASFDTSRGATDSRLNRLQTVQRQFAAITAHGELINRRRPRDYATFMTKATAFAESSATFAGTQATWRNQVTTELTTLVTAPSWSPLATAEREKRIAATLDGLLEQLSVLPDMRGKWLDALKADQRSDFNRAVLTAEYSYQRPDVTLTDLGTEAVIVPAGLSPPSLHTARVIYAQGLGNSNFDFTANQSVSWFDEQRPGMTGHFRDARTSIEGKFKMRAIANYGAPTLSFAGLYVFLNQEPLGLGIAVFNGAKINQRGHIGLFQTKLEFPTANNVVRIPLSFSASNRTELIDESDVRGQIGVSFNLDSLFAERR